MLLVAASGCSSAPEADLSDDQAALTLRPFDRCDPGGPCPDLRLNVDVLKASILIETRDVDPRSCSVNEGTIHDGGRRRLLRFTTSTTNIGTGDLFLGDPSQNHSGAFEFAQCHGHFHFKGYADYELLTPGGDEAAKGHKESFCIEDNIQGTGRSLPPRPPQHLVDAGPAPPTTWTPRQRTDCHHPGLHRGWTDAYLNTTEGNWIDITGVPPGDYVLSVTVNPEHLIAETSFANNHAEVPVHVPDPNADGIVCPASTDAIFRCAENDTKRTKCFRGVTTTERCAHACGQPEEIAHPAQCR